jgi:rhodanese-related sulfurtransferase
MKRFFTSFLCSTALVFLLMLASTGASEELSDEQKLDRVNELYDKYKRSFPDTPDVSVEEVISMQERADVILVDRRERKEQEVSMLPGAITSEQFERNMEKYKDKTIVVYCTIGSRSGYYTKHLIEKGLRAYNLRGSILAWIHAGQRLVSDGEETRRVHVYGRKWNLAPKGYEAVW